MYHAPDFRDPTPIQQDSFNETPWSQAKVVRALDVETAALLRAHLAEDFGHAESWGDLSNRLKNKGFYLKTDGSRVQLHDSHSHVHICSCRFLGYPSHQLESRFNARHH